MNARSLFAAVCVVLSLAVMPGAIPGNAATRGHLETSFAATPALAQLARQYAGAFALPAPPAALGPRERAEWIKARPFLGRSPNAWLDWAAKQRAGVGQVATATTSAPTIMSAVLALYDAMAIRVSTKQLRALDAAAARIPSGIAAPFAELVATVATAYVAQMPLAESVASRVAAGLDPVHPWLTTAERDAMTSRQSAILAAIARFRALTDGRFAAPRRAAESTAIDAPLFADPEGLVILGGLGNDTYTRSGYSQNGFAGDPVLLVDPSGSDTYRNSAGGACTLPQIGLGVWLHCNNLAVSVLADLGTAGAGDHYTFDGVPSAVQGAGGPGGIGVLVDVAGNDTYYAKMTRGAEDTFSVAPYFDGGAQGYGYSGAGALIDGGGNDTYQLDVKSTAGRSIWSFGQGFGGGGGIGIASDATGADRWLANGLGLSGVGTFQGVYTVGVGFYGGVGIMTDTGMGDDQYRLVDQAENVDFYAVGFGAFGGLGIMADDGGNDNYYTYERATGSSPIDPLLNCAYGSGSIGGVGIMIEAGGNDVYYGASVSTHGAYVMDSGFGGPAVGYGVFTDLGGNDRYDMMARGASGEIQGRGLWNIEEAGTTGIGENTWGAFVDAGSGNDVYAAHVENTAGVTTETVPIGANNSTWPFGIDD